MWNDKCFYCDKRFTDEPYILANQAKQVFYIKDLVKGGEWEIVEECNHRGIWDNISEADTTTSALVPLIIQLSEIELLNHRHEITVTEFVLMLTTMKKAVMAKMRCASFFREKMSMST